MSKPDSGFMLSRSGAAFIISLKSEDGTNRLTRYMVESLAQKIENTCAAESPACTLIITGNHKFFSAGADLNEIFALREPPAHQFALAGQRLMNAIDHYPGPVLAAINGFCMGGGLDLALACDHRICSPDAIFGHRGAALGIMTGWGGTQRLPRLIGRSRALEMFLTAEKLNAPEALRIGLVDAIEEDPLSSALLRADRIALAIAHRYAAPVS